MTIEVRIRDENEASPKRLCDWPVTDLDTLITTLNVWGVITEHHPDGEPALWGQVTVTDTAAYFEVVVGDG